MKYSGVYGGTRVLVKDGGSVSGPCEDCAVRGYIGCEKMVLVQKVLLAMGYEGAK